MKIIFTIALVAILISCETERQTNTIVTIKEVSGLTDWRGWSVMQDSSHTVYRSVDLKVFPANVVCYFVNDSKTFIETDFKNYMPKFSGIQNEQKAFANTIHNNEIDPDLTILIIPHKADKSTIAHECTHAADRIMNRLGLTDTECRAYIVSYLMDQMKDVPQWKYHSGSVYIGSSSIK